MNDIRISAKFSDFPDCCLTCWSFFFGSIQDSSERVQVDGVQFCERLYSKSKDEYREVDGVNLICSKYKRCKNSDYFKKAVNND
jgi:hypothetical protein